MRKGHEQGTLHSGRLGESCVGPACRAQEPLLPLNVSTSSLQGSDCRCSVSSLLATSDCPSRPTPGIAQYPIFRIAQSALRLTPWQTCSIKLHLDCDGNHPDTLQLMREGNSYTRIHHCLYPSTRLRFDTAPQDWSPGSLKLRVRSSSHCATAPLRHCPSAPRRHCATATLHCTNIENRCLFCLTEGYPGFVIYAGGFPTGATIKLDVKCSYLLLPYRARFKQHASMRCF